MFKIDLRYDIGNKQRFINIFPWIRLAFALLLDLPIMLFRYFFGKRS